MTQCSADAVAARLNCGAVELEFGVLNDARNSPLRIARSMTWILGIASSRISVGSTPCARQPGLQLRCSAWLQDAHQLGKCIVNSRDLALLSAAVLGVVVLLVLILRRSFFGTARWPFYEKRILTRAEQILYCRLVKAMPDYLVLTKVHLESFLGVKNGYRASAWNRRIGRMSVDFLVCTPDARIVAAIDMDGDTPDTPKRRTQNERKGLALASAGIKLLCWHVRSMPTDTAIRTMLIGRIRHVGPIPEDEPAFEESPPAPAPGKTSYVPISPRSHMTPKWCLNDSR